MREKRDVEKQEALVTELWDFAKRAQDTYRKGSYDCRQDGGASLQLADVHHTLETIMGIFGYVVTEIQ